MSVRFSVLDKDNHIFYYQTLGDVNESDPVVDKESFLRYLTRIKLYKFFDIVESWYDNWELIEVKFPINIFVMKEEFDKDSVQQLI